MQVVETQKLPIQEAVAIIPAFDNYLHFPGRDTRAFRGLPLFLWSILYAKEEGVESVVLTDDACITHTALGFGTLVYPEKPETAIYHDTVKRVIEEYGCKNIILLQPTSPLRKKGALISLLQLLRQGEGKSYYTVEEINQEGKVAGKNIYGEISTQIDGNLFGCTADYFLQENNYFIGCDSEEIINDAPYTLQIHTEEDFKTLELLATTRPELLTHNIRTIACIQNQRCVVRNYSEFIDKCDLVVRSGKMDNIETGRTGTRTDIVFASTPKEWQPYSEEEQHIKETNAVPLIFMNMHSGGKIPDSIVNWFAYPFEFEHYGFTLSATVVDFMHKTFPDAKIFNLGVHDPQKRVDLLTFNSTVHADSTEEAFYDKLVQEGVVVDISEEDKKDDTAIYSTRPGWNVHTPDKIKIFRKVRYGNMPWAYIYPWRRKLVLAEATEDNVQSATVLRWDKGKRLAVQWDNTEDVTVYSSDYTDIFRKADVIGGAEYKEQAARLPLVLLRCTSAWVIGQDCVASYFIKKLCKGTVPGPFDKIWTPNLSIAVELLCRRGKDFIRKDKIDTCVWSDGRQAAFDKEYGHAFLHDFGETHKEEAVYEQLATVSGRFNRRWKRLLEALDDPMSRPLLIYVGHGNLWRERTSKYKFINLIPGEWFSLRRAYESFCRIRATFRADVSFLYIDIPEAREQRRPEIIYSTNNFCAATYDTQISGYADSRADKVWVQLRNDLENIIINKQVIPDYSELEYEPVFCNWGDHRMIIYVHEEQLKGYVWQGEQMVSVDIVQYIRGVELRIYRSNGEEVVFEKDANSVEYRYVSRDD